jgi:hypothetical protein
MPNDTETSSKRSDLLTVQEIALLEGLNHQIAKICVWAHHHQRFEQGLMLLRHQNFSCTEVVLRDLAKFFRLVWQLDAPRTERPNCFLCRALLPEQSDELCKCFRECQVGRYIDPITPQTIDELKRLYPRDWHKIIIETVICEQPSCGALMPITAGVVASKFAKGKTWKSPKLCMNCFHVKQGPMGAPQHQHQHASPQGPRPNRGPRPGSPLRTAIAEANKGKVDLRDLQQTVASESPEVAEG